MVRPELPVFRGLERALLIGMPHRVPSSRATARNNCRFNRAYRAGHRRRRGGATPQSSTSRYLRHAAKIQQVEKGPTMPFGTAWLEFVAGRVQRLMAQARREIVTALVA
jgi:hypothetical protein